MTNNNNLASSTTPGEKINNISHIINRLTMGYTPELYAEIKAIGVKAFIDQQLDPASLDDTETEGKVAQFTRLNMSTAELLATKSRATIRHELNGATTIRAVHSRRQLQEVMVDFWSNHFNVDTVKKNTAMYKPENDRIIREHALGNFSDLLMKIAKSPAMLEYLDNRTSRANGKNVPNENYARELMELHTVGVDGGYTEQDVESVAYLLSGWTTDSEGNFRFNDKHNRFNNHLEEGGDIMGWVPFAPERSIENGESFINFLAFQRATSLYVCWKLCRYFISDEIKQSDRIVRVAARVFRKNDTDIAPTLRFIFRSKTFRQSKGEKVKRSNELMYSILRATDANIDLSEPTKTGNHIRSQLEKMGHALVQCEPPTGYPDEACCFINTNAMIYRWNLGFNLASNRATKYIRVTPSEWIDNPKRVRQLVNQLSRKLLGRRLEKAETQAIYNHLGKRPNSLVTQRELAQLSTIAGLIFATSSYQVR